MNNFFKKIFFIFFSITFLLTPLASFNASSIHAQSQSASTIIPPSFELFANPGDSLTEKIQVRNGSQFANTYNISTQNFSAEGDTGAVNLTDGGVSTTYSLAQWISLDQSSITLPAHSAQTFTFTINVPTGAEPGGHYGAISITTATTGQVAGGAAVSAGQVSLVLLRVSGAVTESASVISFSAPSYSQFGPVPLSLKVKDNGNVHIQPKGTIIITDIFGAKVDEFAIDGRNVLPTAVRDMVTYWNQKSPIGRFTATLVATYGEQNKTILASTTFTVFPKPLAIGIFIGIGAIILLIILLISGRKRISKAFKVIAQG